MRCVADSDLTSPTQEIYYSSMNDMFHPCEGRQLLICRTTFAVSSSLEMDWYRRIMVWKKRYS